MAVSSPGVNPSSITAMTATVLMILLSAVAPSGSTYRYSFIFLPALLWAVYAVRKRLHLGAFHIGVLASALLLHNLGVFGLYRREFFGLQFDTYVHFYFGLCGGFLLSNGLAMGYAIRGWRLWVAVILGILGVGAIHEMIEWASTLALGPQRGMLKTLAEDPYDTQKDLFNNMMGTLLSLACTAVVDRRRAKISAHVQARRDNEPDPGIRRG
jgi:uncharacterized membrane protein YjdF